METYRLCHLMKQKNFQQCNKFITLTGDGSIKKQITHSFIKMMATKALNATETSSAKDLVDLEAIILNWAKQIFEVTKTRDEAKICKRYLQVRIFIFPYHTISLSIAILLQSLKLPKLMHLSQWHCSIIFTF